MATSKNSKHIFQQKMWLGISNLLKEPSSQDPDQPTNYWYSENLNIRTDPYAITLNPASLKESGGTVTDFVKWADVTPASLITYLYGDTGNIYSRTTSGMWSFLHQAASSHGNGLQYFYGDDYLYYTTDSAMGRYGPISATSPTYSDNFLLAQGGIPTNIYSLGLVSASSQYGHAADSASLSIISNLTLEAFFNPTTLPTTGNTMTLIGKWDESGTLRSYKMDILGVSAFFGDGSDGSLTISTNTTEAPIDSACTGTAGATALSATNGSFVANQVVLIHQTKGANAGQWERNIIQSYTSGTITLRTNLIGTYVSGAQVRVTKQHSSVTINSGITYTAKAWNGTTGGILAFLCSGTLTVNGNIVATGKGFRVGQDNTSGEHIGQQGESITGVGSELTTANSTGGGGGNFQSGADKKSGGGGGSNATVGSNGSAPANVPSLSGGAGATTITGSADLTTMTFGGGGGQGGYGTTSVHTGGSGGGILFLTAVTATIGGSATVAANGEAGSNPSGALGGNGGGAGGSVLLKAQTASLGTAQVTATGGAGGTSSGSDGNNGDGGAGGTGRIDINYYTSYTGTTSPTLNAIQDNTLVTTTTYQARLGISSTGLNSEFLVQAIPTPSLTMWNARLSIAWSASTSTAQFYLNGNLFGTSVGTLTAIHDNTSLLYIGANKGASAVQNFFNGLIDDVRIWNNVQTATQIITNNLIELTGSEAGLACYYKFDNSASDSTSNANTLTLAASPTYSVSVPFSGATTRLDIDQSYTVTGQTYTLLTAISEAGADTLAFTPALDPQKSIAFNIASVGTGNVTATIHDQQNNVIATNTIVHASLFVGYNEFIFTTPWRTVIGKTYHAHLTVSTGTTTVVTSASANFASADFYTYYGFLVTDTLFHPVVRWLNFLVIGNERYIAKWDGAFYTANLIAFPPGTHVRCYGIWGIYLAIGTWQERTDGTAPKVSDFSTGKIYFWDGVSLTYNFSIDVPEGQVNTIFGMDNNLYYFAGFRGDLLEYSGTWVSQSGSFNGTKIKRIPYLSSQDYMEVYPQAIANYQGLLYIGMAGNTNSTTLPQGVYSWGALYPQYPQTLSFDHIISTGNKGSTVRIGVVYPVQQKLLVSWKDGIAYGVDVIDSTSGIYHTQGSIQTNILDGEYIYKNDLLLKVRADTLALNTGESVTVGYKLNREANFETSTSITDTLKEFTSNTLSNGRHQEAQLMVQLSSNGSTTPTLLALSGQFDSLDSELAF